MASTTINPSDQTITQYNIQTGGASNLLNNVAPSATSGVPVISQGASSQPVFGTAVVAGGGTGQVTLTNHGVLVGAGTTAITQLAAGSAGQVLQSGGASADPAYSTATYPVTAGTSGNVLTSNGTNFVSSAPASGFSPNSTVNLFDDFMVVYPAANPTVGMLPWDQITSLSFVNLNVLDNAHPGVISNSAFAANSANLFLGGTTTAIAKQFILGGGAITLNWVIKVAILSDGTNTYTLRCGLGDTQGADQVNGCYFAYSSGLNSGNWTGNTAAASSRTPLNSAISVTAAYHNLALTINAGATSIGFSVDGVSLGTAITATIPSLGITPFIDVVRSAGTIAANSIYVDLFYMTQTLTSAR